MKTVHTTIVRLAHPYTRTDVPWIQDAQDRSIAGRLVHYISGGGMRTFGRTISQEVARRRHRRFFFVVGFLAVLWVVAYFA